MRSQQEETRETESGTFSWQQIFVNPPDWAAYSSTLFTTGAVTGTLLDGIHSQAGLQVYDASPIEFGPLHTSLVVPPLLGLFYVVLGTLFPLLDNISMDPATSAARQRSEDLNYVALSFGCLAAALQLSAWLYSNGTPFLEISGVLAVVSLVMWRLFDGTKQGLGLSLLCAVGAPASELLLNAMFGLWHYPQADILAGAFVSWVPFCYFFYSAPLGTLARYLWATARLADVGIPEE